MPTLEPQAIDPATRQALEGVTTATLTTVLLKKGLRNVWMRGARPLASACRARRVGRAFTLRFVPAREDLATPASWASPISTRAAIEAMPAGAIAVVDAHGRRPTPASSATSSARGWPSAASPRWSPTASCATSPACSRTGLPVWCRGTAAPPSVAGLTFVGWQEPIGCGGVAVLPERRDRRRRRRRGRDPGGARRRRRRGRGRAGAARGLDHGRGRARRARCPGSIPPNAATRARYDAWVKGQGKGKS